MEIRPSIHGSLLSFSLKLLCQKECDNICNALFFSLLLLLIVSISNRVLQKDDLLIIFAKNK